MEHDRGRDLTCLERKIISAALSRVESVIRRPFKPEQFSHTAEFSGHPVPLQTQLPIGQTS